MVTAETEANKLAALHEARSRLETALANDENWRALMQRDVSDADRSAERQARDARLTMALDNNPLYRAWRHINEAIEALPQVDTLPAASPVGAAFPGPLRRLELATETSAELPEDIRTVLRHQVAAVNGSAQPEPTPRQQEEGERTEPSSSDKRAEPASLLARPAELEPHPAPPPITARQRHADLIDRIDRLDAELIKIGAVELERQHDLRSEARVDTTVANEADITTATVHVVPASPSSSAAKPAVKAATIANFNAAAPERVRHLPDDGEASVTFVTKTSPQASASARIGTGLRSERKAPLLERLREVPPGGASDEERRVIVFNLPHGPAEEAEVTVVTPQAKQKLQPEHSASAVSRFLKALSGK